MVPSTETEGWPACRHAQDNQDVEQPYELRSIVVFYGSHYLAFCKDPQSGWTKYDDTSIQVQISINSMAVATLSRLLSTGDPV